VRSACIVKFATVTTTPSVTIMKYLTDGTNQMKWRGIAQDSSGNIYVAGTHDLDGVVIAKYNSSLTIQYQRKLTCTASGTFAANGIVVDSTDTFMYISGQVATTSQFLIKLPLDGTLVDNFTAGGGNWTYVASTYTDSTPANLTLTSQADSANSYTITNAASGVSDSANANTTTKTTF
jgi:hypothetical protein